MERHNQVPSELHLNVIFPNLEGTCLSLFHGLNFPTIRFIPEECSMKYSV